MRKKRLVYNTIMAALNQVVILLSGFILPRQILLAFGSDVNGLVASITQFLGFIALLDMGVGAVVQSSLYLPLAENDTVAVSRVMIAADRFFRRIAGILLGYTAVLMLCYPLFIDSSLGFHITALLVMAISFGSFAEYFFGITYRVLLNADQKPYIYLLLQSMVILLNTVVSVILIRLGASILTVKLAAICVLPLCPVFLTVYVRRNYRLDYGIPIDKDPLSQRWNAMAQHISEFIVKKTDIVVLTILSTLSHVSVYCVYHMVVQQLYQAFAGMMAAVQPMFGNMYVKNEKSNLINTFMAFEWGVHTAVVFLYTCTSVLIVPFVRVYTRGIMDVDYLQPVFGTVLTAAYAVYCLREFYNILIKAVGDYKQTQTGAIIEAVLNMGISILLVKKFGLIGVAAGTCIAVLYRVIYFIVYIYKKILCIGYSTVIRQIVIDVGTCLLIYVTTAGFSMHSVSYASWIILAVKVCSVALFETVCINVIWRRGMMKRTAAWIGQRIENE